MTSDAGGAPSRVAVVIATCDRPALLAGRALPSVCAQERTPDLLVVVDDSRDEAARLANREAVEAVGGLWIPNRRTPGASGAWNTGIVEAWTRLGDDAWIAILDDDDAWTPAHLRVVLESGDGHEVVATAMLRHDGGQPRVQLPPEVLRPGDFLVGNPHVQGSNLAVRAARLLEAGLFDEGLPSCTDRDLCLRLGDLPGLRYARVEVPTVHHHAEADHPRLSTPGSRAKAAGLLAFWRKWRGRMDEAQRAAFLQRAERLFGWRPAEGAAEIAWVVGIVADAGRPRRVEPLLRQLLTLSREDGVAGLDVVLVENGPPADGLARLCVALREEGLRVYRIDLDAQRHDAASGAFGAPFDRGGGRLPIAPMRSMLQAYVYTLARRRPGCVAWILDDDKRLDPLFDAGAARGGVGRWLAHTMRRFRERGMHVVIGTDAHAAPLPAVATLRVQLVDLLHNLDWLAGLDPDAPLPDRSAENADVVGMEPYHDLSTAGASHLETPTWWTPAFPGETVRAARVRLLAAVPRLRAGDPLFRALPADVPADPVADAFPSWRRGGNTFVLDVEALADCPNLSPGGAHGAWRRSDMAWAVLQQRRFGREVVLAQLPVRHYRGDADGPLGGDIVADCLGHAAVQALAGAAAFDEALARRAQALDLSLRRARALAVTIAARHADVAETIGRLASELQPVVVPEDAGETFACFERGLEDGITAWRTAMATREGLRVRLEEERSTVAEALARRHASGPLRRLGAGAEGVVFTDGTHVLKVFDAWKSRAAAAQRTFLRGLVGRWPEARGLYPLLALHEDGANAVLVYPFEPGEPYRGGDAPGLARLLRECRAHGVVCDNLHPKNLLATAEGTRLVDYGSDIRPYSEAGFDAMCRRAFLCWRWWFRSDLPALLRAALVDATLPELCGWERLREAAIAPSPEPVLHARLVDRALDARPARVLDYGCGKGKVARAIARAGVEVVGYDPDTTLPDRWSADGPGPTLVTALPADAVDLAVCSLVLCTLDDPAYAAAIADLSRAVRPGGTLLVAVCDPAFATVSETPFRARPCPDGADLDETFAHADGHVHRPAARLRRDLLRAGFVVEREWDVPTVDVARLEPASAFLVLELRRVRLRPIDASLVVKASAMDAAMLEPAVEHLVGQLEGPRAFAEVILALDDRAAGHPRPWITPDPDGLARVADRLVRRGLVDRVLRAPTGDDLRDLHRRWFGGPSDRTHADNGSPVAVPLAAFEAARSPWIVQVDADLIVGRDEPRTDWLARLVEAAGDAVTVSLPIAPDGTRPPSDGWRVEVRGCLLHRERLLAMRPLPNPREGWYRALDAARPRSVRVWDAGVWFVHPPNATKPDGWSIPVDRAEAGVLPDAQRGVVELADADWLAPKRAERFVFLVQGRDVPPGRLLRCLTSIRAQARDDWGLVIVDDGSAAWNRDFLARVADARTTLLRPRLRRGKLANLLLAVRRVCIDPETVVVVVDADDALAGPQVLDRLAREYDDGADLTVGSMLRTDKEVRYEVRFDDLRANRGGAVWQHLRSFRKRLVDRLPDEAFMVDGAFPEIANDWALMVPLVEAAASPRAIPEVLYLHEPSGRGKGAERHAREAVIARVMARGNP